MASFVPTSAETLEDRRLYTEARLVEVGCRDCPVCVRVKKNSDHHTSTQWGEHGQDLCPEFRRMAEEPGGRHVHARCERLAASIEEAVREGRVPIGAEDGW